jgi:hypothetical protein
MSANNLQTNRNASRFFFATSENGEQTLGLQYGSTGGSPNLSTMAVTISGSGGNGVIVNTAPSYAATDYIFAEQGMGVYGSTYFTPSTLINSVTGVNISSDRIPGSGMACIEAYSGNGATTGFEFLVRGVDSVVVSSITTSANQYISSIGRPGAAAVIGGNGSLLTSEAVITPFFTSLNAQAGVGGRPCFGIQDLSGALGVTPQPRWAIGTTGIATGANAGSDFTLFSYNDAGTFLDAPFSVRRADSAMTIGNISSIFSELGGTAKGQVFPVLKDNTEFGIPAVGNTAVVDGTLQVLFSTPVANLNPNNQTLLNINWANALSTTNGHINYKVGFSTATAYTNIIQTSYVPGGAFSPSGAPTTILGHTNICCILDPDGLDASGAGFLYIAGQTADGSTDLLYLDKGTITEPTRNALCYKTI